MTQLTSLAYAPGTLREYETIYILKPNTQNDGVAEVNRRVREIIEGRGGKILAVDNWGKRRLAYEVKKELRGIYLYWKYLANPDVVVEFERHMRMLDEVIRYMTVLSQVDVQPDAVASEVTAETYEKAANTAADEEELMLRRSPDEADVEREVDEDDDMMGYGDFENDLDNDFVSGRDDDDGRGRK
jgi:small subunit ribosomal protein S6